MEPEAQHDATEQPIVPEEPPTMEMDLEPGEMTTELAATSEPEPPELAEPGVYVCIAEDVGESPVLGVLTFGTEYDYSATQDTHVLEAVAACVAAGYLEKV